MSKLRAIVIQKAIQTAKKSDSCYRIGAVIFNKKEIISTGYNDSERSVRSVTKSFVHRKNSIHAEVMAILLARKKLKGYSMLVIRINKQDEFRLAKPCEHCLGYLDFVGIKEIYYSTENGIVKVKNQNEKQKSNLYNW